MVFTVTDFKHRRLIHPGLKEPHSLGHLEPVSKGTNDRSKTHNTDDPSGYVDSSDDHVFL